MTETKDMEVRMGKIGEAGLVKYYGVFDKNGNMRGIMKKEDFEKGIKKEMIK